MNDGDLDFHFIRNADTTQAVTITPTGATVQQHSSQNLINGRTLGGELVIYNQRIKEHMLN